MNNIGLNSQIIGLSKMTGQKFFIGTRRTNGQISSISRGLDPVEFIELFKEKGEIKVLIEYSPLIELLHDMHKSANEEETRCEYDSMFHYWQDAKTYADKQYRMHCSSELITKAIKLINRIRQKLEKSQHDDDFYFNFNPHEMPKNNKTVNALKIDTEIYMDALLIYIHSKASTEIGSFENDTTLSFYVNYLHEIIQNIYFYIIKQGHHGHSESFLKYLAIERQSDFQQHMKLIGGNESRDEFILRILGKIKPCKIHYNEYPPGMRVAICYDDFWPKLMLIIEIIKDLLYKIKSINDLLKDLKEGGVVWDEDGASADDLRALLQLGGTQSEAQHRPNG